VDLGVQMSWLPPTLGILFGVYCLWVSIDAVRWPKEAYRAVGQIPKTMFVLTLPGLWLCFFGFVTAVAYPRTRSRIKKYEAGESVKASLSARVSYHATGMSALDRTVTRLLEAIEQRRSQGLREFAVSFTQSDVGTMNRLDTVTPLIIEQIQEAGHAVVGVDSPQGGWSYTVVLQIRPGDASEGFLNQTSASKLYSCGGDPGTTPGGATLPNARAERKPKVVTQSTARGPGERRRCVHPTCEHLNTVTTRVQCTRCGRATYPIDPSPK
jgi:hypothetical protein